MKYLLVITFLMITSLSSGQSMKGYTIGEKLEIGELEVINLPDTDSRGVIIQGQSLAGKKGIIMLSLSTVDTITGIFFVTYNITSIGEFEAFLSSVESNYKVTLQFNEEYRHDDNKIEYYKEDGWIEYRIRWIATTIEEPHMVFFYIMNNMGDIDDSDF